MSDLLAMIEERDAALRLALPCLLEDAVQLIESDSHCGDDGWPRPGTYGGEMEEGGVLPPILAAIRAAEACVGTEWRLDILEPEWIFQIIDGTRLP